MNLLKEKRERVFSPKEECVIEARSCENETLQRRTECMTIQILTLEDVKYRTVEELLRSVSTAQEILDIMLPNGAEVLIQPKPPLQPLPELDGYIPAGWKDAIYTDAE
jgi:hypothetical protein